MGLFNDVDMEDFTHRRLPCQCNGKLKLMKQRENRQCVIATVSLHKLSIIRRPAHQRRKDEATTGDKKGNWKIDKEMKIIHICVLLALTAFQN